MRYEDQPKVPEPQIQIGETVWSDEDGTSVGKISAITNETVIVSFRDRVSSYQQNKVNVAFLPPYLVLVGCDERIIHRY